MSAIRKLNIVNIRNIREATMEPSPAVNLLHGENGSGKTSILESIHLLATGRSFRSAKLDSLINNTESKAVAYMELASGHSVGLSKSRRQAHRLKLDKQPQRNWDTIARELPVQILDATSFLLLEGGPKARRRFLDWGVFHVEPSFLSSWRRSRKCIANRNLLLKQSRLDRAQLQAWDAELCQAANAVHAAREQYFNQFLPVFSVVYESLADSATQGLSLAYHRGWDSAKELEEVLEETRSQDEKYGASQNGPHRADIAVKIGNRPAVETLSRGQQKILVSALKIAQGILLTRSLDRHCIYLVDDLPAELDLVNRSKILNQLMDLGGQLFVTCVDLDALEKCLPEAPEMATFHVERGTITG
jgi:DNA replication and repair protein RecF